MQTVATPPAQVVAVGAAGGQLLGSGGLSSLPPITEPLAVDTTGRQLFWYDRATMVIQRQSLDGGDAQVSTQNWILFVGAQSVRNYISLHPVSFTPFLTLLFSPSLLSLPMSSSPPTNSNCRPGVPLYSNETIIEQPVNLSTLTPRYNVSQTKQCYSSTWSQMDKVDG